MKRVLVVRPGALGDAILTLPALAQLRVAGVEKVSILGTPSSWRFLAPNLSDIELFDFGGSEWLGLFSNSPLSALAIHTLKECDTAIVYLNAEHGEQVCTRLSAAGIKHVLRIDPPLAGMTGDTHAADRLCSIQSSHDANHIDRWLASTTDEIETAQRARRLNTGTAYFAIHPGSGGKQKCWPSEFYVELLRSIQTRTDLIPVVLLGEAEEKLQAHFSALNGVRIVAQRSLREVLAILRGARFYVGNDSGISHLAARATRTLALFGPTSPAQWRPLGADVKTMLAPNGDLRKLSVEHVLAHLSDWLPGEKFS